MFEYFQEKVPKEREGLPVFAVKKKNLTADMVRLSTMLWESKPSNVDVPVYLILKVREKIWIPIGIIHVFEDNMQVKDVWVDEEEDDELHLPIGIVVQWAWSFVLKGRKRRIKAEQKLVLRFLNECMDADISMCRFAEEYREMFCKSIEEKGIDLYED